MPVAGSPNLNAAESERRRKHRLGGGGEPGSIDKSPGKAFLCRHSGVVCYQNSKAEKKQNWGSFWLGE
jgi:hypothetical protein